MHIGTIKWFDFEKGYGFIKPDDGSRDIFLHISEVKKAGIVEFQGRQRVMFTRFTQGNKELAIDISLI